MQLSSLTLDDFENFWDQLDEQCRIVYSAEDPNLEPFGNRGGKIILWHGQADELIPAAGSINYFNRVVSHFGGTDRANGIIRLFLAPGVNHCGGGNGSIPIGIFDALIDWVENGNAPKTLMSIKREPKTGKIIRHRPLCLFPKIARYKGDGSVIPPFPTGAISKNC